MGNKITEVLTTPPVSKSPCIIAHPVHLQGCSVLSARKPQPTCTRMLNDGELTTWPKEWGFDASAFLRKKNVASNKIKAITLEMSPSFDVNVHVEGQLARVNINTEIKQLWSAPAGVGNEPRELSKTVACAEEKDILRDQLFSAVEQTNTVSDAIEQSKHDTHSNITD
eukprot:jgi/Bigna1/84700/fgenesh1_pg.226_\